MDDGLKQANLAALLTRGPWTGGTGADAWTLTSAEVGALYAAIPEGKAAMRSALGVASLSCRKADRALTLLKSTKLIVYAGVTRWEQT